MIPVYKWKPTLEMLTIVLLFTKLIGLELESKCMYISPNQQHGHATLPLMNFNFQGSTEC